MPAYFDVMFQFDRKRIEPGFVNSVYSNLINAGLLYVGGIFEDICCSYDEIVSWNQKLLQDNFEAKDTTTRGQDYKQILFKHPLYSEVRGFWINYPEDNEVIFYLIIPEDDVYRFKTQQFLQDKVEFLINLGCKIWATGSVDAIQTEMELGGAYQLHEIRNKCSVLVSPFAIVNNRIVCRIKEQYKINKVYPDGLLITDAKLISS